MPTISNSRPMFWRIVRRLLTANRGRLIVILLALGAGAAVTAALLNLQIDAKRRLTTEFRAFGANIIIAPREAARSNENFLYEGILKEIPTSAEGQMVSVVPFLYLVADAYSTQSKNSVHTVIAGTSQTGCKAGSKVASAMHLRVNDELIVRSQGREEKCRLAAISSTGGSEDNQISFPLDAAQRLAGLRESISLIQISVPGTPRAINNYIADLTRRLPDVDVHPIRQFTEAEGKIYNRISSLLTATVAVVLILTTLCVMAAMTNVAMERKNDVGLMKAIGGATRRVLRLFLAEAAVLGLLGGVLGAAAGILLSIALGKAVFGVAAQPRLIVYPISVTLTILVAIAGAYPLRRLASIRPASIFRGE
jgi:putative ABC transport system permease protein